MAAKNTPETVRLVNAEGVAVNVSAEKAERLVAGGGYTADQSKKSAKADTK